MCLAFTVQAQDYIMFSTVTLDPVPSKMKELRQGLADHKAKYHEDNTPFQASLFRISSGPNSGKIIWLEGPQKFSDFDDYDGLGQGHGEHWGTQVEGNCQSMGHTEYWKEWDQYSRNSSKLAPIYVNKYLAVNVKERQGFRINGLLEKLSAAIKTIEGDFSWSIYSNEFEQGKLGRHFVIVTSFDSWTELDKEVNQFGQRKKIRTAFDKIHGEGSHQRFMDEWRDVFEDSYDEVLAVMNLDE